jgi:hypothetical protein
LQRQLGVAVRVRVSVMLLCVLCVCGVCARSAETQLMVGRRQLSWAFLGTNPFFLWVLQYPLSHCHTFVPVSRSFSHCYTLSPTLPALCKACLCVGSVQFVFYSLGGWWDCSVTVTLCCFEPALCSQQCLVAAVSGTAAICGAAVVCTANRNALSWELRSGVWAASLGARCGCLPALSLPPSAEQLWCTEPRLELCCQLAAAATTVSNCARSSGIEL